MPGFTAVGYYFAREISPAPGGAPVGPLNATWGGTAIQSWMSVTIDAGESEDIHPPDKWPVGGRLARIALRRTYGQPIADRGPSHRAMRLERGGHARLSFDDTEGGLTARDGAPRHFELAGEDGGFHPADALIQGNEIVLSCATVPRLTAVRYAWPNDPTGCNLYDREDLPAMPFRTDNW